MNPKLIKINKIEYAPGKFAGKNMSGTVPLGDRVLVMPDTVNAASTGGVMFTDDMLDRLNLSATSGIMVEFGDDAFTWNSDRSRPFSGRKPKVGDRIYFEKFAGLSAVGDDGISYRLMDDKCVGGLKVSVQ